MLVEAAFAAARTPGSLRAFYRRVSARRGSQIVSGGEGGSSLVRGVPVFLARGGVHCERESRDEPVMAINRLTSVRGSSCVRRCADQHLGCRRGELVGHRLRGALVA